MKKISILIPCYNEEENVVAISKALTDEINAHLSSYDYEIVFIDNDSKDNTRPLLRELCRQDHKIKAIFNAKNFGQFNSPYYGLLQTTGDCTVMYCCDFQDPIELLPDIIAEWEKGAKLVTCIKTQSKENLLIRFLRTCYYKTIRKMSTVEQIDHFTGFGLYDRSFIKVMSELKDPTPFLRGVVAELGYKRVSLPYTQQKRRAGSTHNNFFTLFDAAMLSFTSYTRVGLHLVTFIGFVMALLSLLVAITYFIYKMVYWDRFSMGLAPLIIGMFFFNAVQLMFIGFVGEYVMSINTRVMNRPLVIEEERINF